MNDRRISFGVVGGNSRVWVVNRDWVVMGAWRGRWAQVDPEIRPEANGIICNRMWNDMRR